MHSTDDELAVAPDVLALWLRQVRLQVGEGISHGALTLVPLLGESAHAGATYRTLAAALQAGEGDVTEAPQAHVPTLQVRNHGTLPILILDGEEVVGGRQNRVVNTSLLVPPKSVFPLPVSCVEHGRWHETRATFVVGETAYPKLRQEKLEQVSASLSASAMPLSDQGAVWEEIAQQHRRGGTRSATGALRDAYAQRELHLAAAARALQQAPRGALGVVAVIGGRAVCADVFDRPATLRAYWPRLVRSYALEAADADATLEAPHDSAAARQASARDLLRRATIARLSPFRSPGLGTDVRIQGQGISGAALVHAGSVVHTAVFRQRRSAATAGPSLRRPSERARRRPG